MHSMVEGAEKTVRVACPLHRFAVPLPHTLRYGGGLLT